MQTTISFRDTVVDVVVQEEEDAKATVAVAKRYKPLHLKEEALATSPLLAIHMALGDFLKTWLS